MPRIYKRSLGSREYKNYSDSVVENALQSVLDGRSSLRGASKELKIPYATLYNKYKGKHIRKPSAQPVFSGTEEKASLQSAAKCSEWGFPLSLLDLRMFAKAFLDRSDRIVAKFPDNVPGVDWTYSILRRHKDAYIPKNLHYKLYCDYYFTSIPLFSHLSQNGIDCTGTGRTTG
jgi:hypothetical protein